MELDSNEVDPRFEFDAPMQFDFSTMKDEVLSDEWFEKNKQELVEFFQETDFLFELDKPLENAELSPNSFEQALKRLPHDRGIESNSLQTSPNQVNLEPKTPNQKASRTSSPNLSKSTRSFTSNSNDNHSNTNKSLPNQILSKSKSSSVLPLIKQTTLNSQEKPKNNPVVKPSSSISKPLLRTASSSTVNKIPSNEKSQTKASLNRRVQSTQPQLNAEKNSKSTLQPKIRPSSSFVKPVVKKITTGRDKSDKENKLPSQNMLPAKKKHSIIVKVRDAAEPPKYSIHAKTSANRTIFSKITSKIMSRSVNAFSSVVKSSTTKPGVTPLQKQVITVPKLLKKEPSKSTQPKPFVFLSEQRALSSKTLKTEKHRNPLQIPNPIAVNCFKLTQPESPKLHTKIRAILHTPRTVATPQLPPSSITKPIHNANANNPSTNAKKPLIQITPFRFLTEEKALKRKKVNNLDVPLQTQTQKPIIANSKPRNLNFSTIDTSFSQPNSVNSNKASLIEGNFEIPLVSSNVFNLSSDLNNDKTEMMEDQHLRRISASVANFLSPSFF